jgi:predicted DCC family thiol-disulfide oxidoreductase YuxK
MATTAELVPYQITDLARLGTTVRRAEHEVLWVDRRGRVFGGAQAVAELLIDAGGAWRPAGVLMRLPPVSRVASVVYRLIARNRRRLPGGTSACAANRPWRPR